ASVPWGQGCGTWAIGGQHARGFFAVALIGASWPSLRVLFRRWLHSFQLARKLPRQGSLLCRSLQISNVAHLIGGEHAEHVGQWPGFHPRPGALPQRRQRRIV